MVCAITCPALPACRVQDLPHQDNHCDCGLFVLAYLHFFTAYPPSDVDGDKKDPKAAISEFECTKHPVGRVTGRLLARIRLHA